VLALDVQALEQLLDLVLPLVVVPAVENFSRRGHKGDHLLAKRLLLGQSLKLILLLKKLVAASVDQDLV